MAPPGKKRSNAPETLYEFGIQGRRTGAKLKDDGRRDENGFQPLDSIFSSPTHASDASLGEADMDIESSSRAPNLSALRPTFAPGRSPPGTGLQSPARRKPRTQPVSSSNAPRAAGTAKALFPKANGRQPNGTGSKKSAGGGGNQRREALASAAINSPVQMVDVEDEPEHEEEEGYEEGEEENSEDDEDAEDIPAKPTPHTRKGGPAPEGKSTGRTVQQTVDDARRRSAKQQEKPQQNREVEQDEPDEADRSNEPQILRRRGKRADKDPTAVPQGAGTVASPSNRRARLGKRSLDERAEEEEPGEYEADEEAGMEEQAGDEEHEEEHEEEHGEEHGEEHEEEQEEAYEEDQGAQDEGDQEDEPPSQTRRKTASTKDPRKPSKTTKPGPDRPSAQSSRSKPKQAAAAEPESSRPAKKRKTGRQDTTGIRDQAILAVQKGPPLPRGRGLLSVRQDASSFTQTRSGRHSYQPLRYWAGEHIEYDTGDSRIVQDKTINKARRFVVPSIAGIMRVEEEGPPAVRKAGSRGGGKKAGRRGPPEDGEESPEEWELDPGTVDGEIVTWKPEYADRPPGPEEAVDVEDGRVAVSSSSTRPRRVRDGDFQFVKTMTMPFMGTGLLDLPPGTSKKPKNSRKMHMAFFVYYGKVLVNVASNEFRISAGNTFFVPRGNYYSIQNDYDHVARLFFCQGCETLTQDYEESTTD